MSERVDLLEKIRALLAKAEATEYAEEADAFLAGAQRLIAAHAVAEGELRVTESEEIITHNWWIPDPYSMAKAHIAEAITKHAGFYCYVNRTTRDPERGKGRWLTVAGTETNLAVGEALYTSLVTQCTRQVLKLKGRSGGETKSMRDRFIVGFSMGVRDKLRKSSDEAETASPGHALVLLEEKDQAKAWLLDQDRDLRLRRGSGKRASQEGHRAGRNADVGQGKFSRSQKALGAG